MSATNDMAINYPMEARSILWRFLPPGIIAACIFFNFFLCFINTNITGITPALIILCEMVLTAVAVLTGFYRIDRIKLFWLVILGLQFVLIGVLSVFKGEVLMKPIRDIMIMPIFTVLGIAAFRINFSKFLIWISVVITIVALCEAFLTETYLSLFNLREFYIAKGVMESDKTITALDVFASGERPGGRFLLELPGIHRISSVFLEPVSLGFYAMISGIYFIAAKEGLAKKIYISGLAMSFFLIWLSDARMALGTLVLTLILRPVFARFDHRLSVLVLPFLLLIAYTLDIFNFLGTSGEGMGARVHSTINLLAHTNLDIFLGLSKYETVHVADSALGYILNDQGFLGLLLFWLPPIFFLKSMPQEARIYLFGVCLYIAFGMILTQAFFTIKTAALLWFCYGYLISRNLRDAHGNYHYAT
jgi:putative polymerase